MKVLILMSKNRRMIKSQKKEKGKADSAFPFYSLLNNVRINDN